MAKPQYENKTAFLVARLENYTDRSIHFLTSEFSCGGMDVFGAEPLAPASAKHWTCAPQRWLQGNIGCAVFGVGNPGVHTVAAAVDEAVQDICAEVCVLWHFPYVGSQDRVGIQIGPPGTFSRKTQIDSNRHFMRFSRIA